MKLILAWACMAMPQVLLGADISIASASGSPGSTTAMDVTLRSSGGAIVAIQFDVEFDPSAISIKGEIGPAGEKAGKALSVSDPAENRKRFIVAGLNQSQIEDGAILILRATINENASPGLSTLHLLNQSASDKTGQTIPITGVDGSITVDSSASPAVSFRPADLLVPMPGTRLSGPRLAFAWTTGLGATEYSLFVGASPGLNDLFDSGLTSELAVTVEKLPTDGKPIYVTLFSHLGENWETRDYVLDAASSCALDGTSSVLASHSLNRY